MLHYVRFPCWWWWRFNWPGLLWKFSLFYAEFVFVLSEYLTLWLAASFLSFSLFRRWSCQPSSPSDEDEISVLLVFLLWFSRRRWRETLDIRALLQPINRDLSVTEETKAHFLPQFSWFLWQWKTPISYFHQIYSFIFKRNESTCFIFIWNTQKILQKQNSCFFCFL